MKTTKTLLFFNALLLVAASCGRRSSQDNGVSVETGAAAPKSLVGKTPDAPKPTISPKVKEPDSVKPSKPFPEHIKKMIDSCEKGTPSSCRMLSTLFLKGVGVGKDRRLAMRYSRLAKENYKKILPDWEQRCEKGNAGDCMNAGLAYRDSLGVPRDAVKSVRLFKQAADLFRTSCEKTKNAGACNSAARVYWLGLLRTPELRKDRAFRQSAKVFVSDMFEKGCALGNPDACGSLGDVYRDGDLVRRDEAKAMGFYRRGCELSKAGSHEKKRLCAYAALKKLPPPRRRHRPAHRGTP